MVITVSELFGQIQDSSIMVIPSSYSLSMQRPKLVRSGQIIKFEADSIYLVNKSRESYYEELRNKLVTLDFDCEPAIELFKNSLSRNSILTHQLIENSENTNQLNTKLVHDTKQLLNRNNEALNLTLKNLTSANENLDLAKKELSKMRTFTLLENILYSLTGIGIGLIIGISLN